jgi:hypothetical protein
MAKYSRSLLMCLLVVKLVLSQDRPFAKFEAGGGFSVFRIGQFGQVLNYPGIEARVVYNIIPAFSFDSAVNFYPTDFKGFNQINVQQGGRAFLAEFGLRGGTQRRNVRILGFIRPGIVSFSRVEELNSLATQRRTSFLMDLGGTLEAYPSERIITFLEVGAPLIMFAKRTKALGGGASLFAPGSVQSGLRISTGVKLRLGQLSQEALEPPARSRRYEVGLLFSTLSLQRFLGTLKHEPGVGIRGSYNLTDHLSFDSEIDYFPRNPHALSAQEGGKILLGEFGPKAGIRRGKAGLFAKARPGFLRYSQTLQNDSVILSPRYSSLTQPVLDVGGILELYPSSATVLRFDVGDTIVRYRSRRVPGFQVPFPAFTRHTVQVSTGFAFRF